MSESIATRRPENHRIAVVLSVLLICGMSTGALAATLTFDGSPGGYIVAPLVEGDYAIGVHSGGIFSDLLQGGPEPDMEGSIIDGGGTLRVTRNDVVGGLFTFDQVSVAQFGMGTTDVVFEGYLGGVLQSSDTFPTFPANLVHFTYASSSLAGVWIDELRVQLDAGAQPFRWESVDNIALSSANGVHDVPSLSPLGITILCCLLCAASWRKAA